ncbi:10725_t:CDS:2 [Acaulospora morrowiae]|uniref:10725_t:CDS:1 n=1 Tax=Acaulospora morrowiae TaxID=94023 RepID=A0A9N8WPR1_9GLOM|nr:10725_t:CDS:2 [Acaulospora morrowiae]
MSNESVKAKKREVDDMMRENSQFWRDPYDSTSSISSPLTNSIYSCPDQSMDGTHGVKPKRRRGNLPKATTARLKEWLADHRRHPYPTEDQKITLAQETMLTLQQISNWFINARRRHLPLLLGINPQKNSGNVYKYGSDNSAEDSTSDSGKRIRGCYRACQRKSDLIGKPHRRNRRKY